MKATDSIKVRQSLISVYKKYGLSCKYESSSISSGIMKIHQETCHKLGSVITNITFDDKSNICTITHNNGEKWSTKSFIFTSSEEFLSLYDKTIDEMLNEK